MPKLEIKAFTGPDGLTNLLELVKNGRTLTATYDETTGLTIDGELGSLPELKDVLPLYFPQIKTPHLEIPQPLEVTQVSGGKTVFFDDFESLLKWAGSGTVAIDNTNAFNGGQCLHLSNATGNASARKLFPMPLSRKLELSFKWCFDDFSKFTRFRITVGHQLPNNSIVAEYEYVRANQLWEYAGQLNDYTVPNSTQAAQYETLDDVNGAWHSFKANFDFNNLTYDYLQVNDKKFSVNLEATNRYRQTAGANDIDSYVLIAVYSTGGFNCRIDDVLLREVA